MTYNDIREQAEREIFDTCRYGTFKALINLRTEVVSEITSNKFYLQYIDKAIQKRLEGDFNVQEAKEIVR